MYTADLVAGVGLQTFVAGVMIAQLTAGMATRDAAFLSEYAATSLPYVMGASALLSFVAVAIFSRLLVRWGPDRVVPAAFALNAVLFGVEAIVSRSAPAPTAVLTYLHTMVFGGLLVSGFWSLMTERFDPHVAKRVFGTIGAGCSIGGVLGGIAAGQGGPAVSFSTMLVFLAALNVVGATALLAACRGSSERAARAVSPAEPAPASRPRYLRHLAWLVVVTAVADVTLDYVFKSRAAAAFQPEDLIQFFALFYAVTNVISFLVQALLARPLLQNVGLSGTLACQPIMAALGSVVAMFVPGVWPVTLIRTSDSSLRTSLFKAGYELLYTPLQPAQKRAVKTKIDVGFSRLGGLTGSVLVLAAVSVNYASALLGIVAVASVISVLLVVLLHRGYVLALADSLMHSSIRLEPGDVEDATTRRTLAMTTMGLDHEVLREQMASLRAQLSTSESPDGPAVKVAQLSSGDLTRIRAILAKDVEPALVAFVLPLLTRDELVDDVTRALRKIAPRITGQLVDALVDPASPRLVRRRVPRILVASQTQRAVDGLVLGLAADTYDVRHRCVLALERLTELAPALVIERGSVLEAARVETRKLGGGRDREHLDQIFLLLGLVLERRPLKLAHRALASGDHALRGTGLEYLENVLPAEMLERLKPHLGVQGAARGQRSTEVLVKVLVDSMPGVLRSDTDGPGAVLDAIAERELTDILDA